jgi:hypothetical protein
MEKQIEGAREGVIKENGKGSKAEAGRRERRRKNH